MTTTTTYRKDYLGRWLANTQPGTSNATDYCGRTVKASNKDYMGRALTFANPAVWATGTQYAAGAYVKPKTGTNYDAVFIALDAGTSHGATEPTWPTTLYGTVVDNPGGSSVTWKCVHV
jgi:hypothetical protein